MRGLVWVGGWVGCVLLLAACTRENGAFDGSAGGGTATTGGSGTTRGVDADGPQPGTGSASGTVSGVDGNTVDDAPPPTTGPEGTSEGVTTMPSLDGTSTTASTEEGTTSSVMEGGSSTTGIDPPTTCCMGESCDDQNIANDCVCFLAPQCCRTWNFYCTSLAVQECGLMCVPPPGDCCEPNELFAGCNDFEVMSCVCSVGDNADCCSIGWTEACAEYAAMHCIQCDG